MCIMSSNSLFAQQLGFCAANDRCFSSECPKEECPEHCLEAVAGLLDGCREEKRGKIVECVLGKIEEGCQKKECMC